MPTLFTTRNYSNGAAPTKSMLDAFLNSIETFFNTTKLASDNLQTSGITGTKFVGNEITGDKLASTIVDNATLAYNAGVLSVKPGGIGASQIAAGQVFTTAMFANGAVTPATREAVNYVVSSSCGTFSTSGSSTSFVDVTNLSVTITTTGRPIRVGTKYDGSTSSTGTIGFTSAQLNIESSGGPSTPGGSARILRDVTTILQTVSAAFVLGPGDLTAVDFNAAAGTHTFKVQMQSGFQSSTYYPMKATGMVLYAVEL